MGKVVEDLKKKLNSAIGAKIEQRTEKKDNEEYKSFIKAEAMKLNNMFDDAIEEYKKVLKINPHHLEAMRGLGIVYKYSSEKIFSFFCFFIHFSILSAIKTTRFLAKGRIRFPLFAGKKKGQRQAMYSLCCPKRPFPGQGTECPKNLYENVTARCPRMHCLRSGPTPACRYASQGRKAHACRRRG